MFKREIEKKYVVSNYGSYDVLRRYVESLIHPKHWERGSSEDTFWEAKGADFIRLRENTKELTIKRTDKGDIVDRLEENLLVTSYDAGYVWATAVWGDPVGSIEKHYSVYYVDNAVVSVYYVEGDERMFLEVEADTIDKVNELSKLLNEHLALEQEFRSLYQIFFDGLAPKVVVH